MKEFHQKLIFFLFFLSGISALIYELVWVRRLSTVIGASSYATGTVLAVYMAGLAIGSFIFGRLIDKYDRRILKTSGYIQLAIAFSSILAYNLLDIAFKLSGFLKFTYCFMLLLLPATIIGGTLPVLSKFFYNIKDTGEGSRSTGILYAVNTLGAVIGAFLAGFLFIEILGLKTTLLTASAVNMLIGITFIMMDRKLTIGTSPPEPSSHYHLNNEDLVVLIVYGITGFIALSYEVLWMRLLLFSWKSTAYSFSVILTVYLFGSSLGSFVCARITRKMNRQSALFLLGAAEALTGIFVMISLPLTVKLPEAFAKFSASAGSWPASMTLKFLASFIAVIIPVFLLGAMFVLVVKILERSSGNAGKVTGSIFSANTIGCLLGPLVTSFILVPALGISGSMKLIVVINLLLCALILLIVKSLEGKSRKIIITLMAAGFILVILVPSFKQHFPGEKVLYYREGPVTTVKVVRGFNDTASRMFSNNWEVGNSLPGSIRYARIQGYLPLLLHGNPGSVFLLGLGAGMTAGAVSLFDLPIDCAEIAPEIVEGAAYFSNESYNILNNPSFNIIIDDGRNLLLRSAKKYDIIISDLVNPGKDVANLYSREYYETCRASLHNNGLFCQWISLAQVPEKDLKMILNGFYRTFPDSSLWLIGSGKLLGLVGTMKELKIDFNSIKRMLSLNDRILKDLSETTYTSPFTLIRWFLMGSDGIKKYARGISGMNTDDHPYIDYTAPKMAKDISVMAFSDVNELSLLREDVLSLVSGIKPQEKNIARMYLESGNYLQKGRILFDSGDERAAFHEFESALAINPMDEDAKYLMEISPAHERAALKAVERDPFNINARMNLAYIYTTNNEFDMAIRQINEVIRIQPHFMFFSNLASVYEKKGDTKTAINNYKKSLELNPGFELARKKLQYLLNNRD